MRFNPEEYSGRTNLLLVKRILTYFRPYRWHIALSFVCLAVVAITTAGTAWLIRPAMDEIFLSHNRTALVLVPLGYVALTLFKGLGRYGQNMTLNYSGLNVLRVIRNQVFQKMLKLPLPFFEKSEVGTLMSHITYDVGMMQLSLPAVITIVRQTLTMLALLAVVFYQNWRLALWAMLALPLLGFPITWFSRKLRHYGRRSANINADISTSLQELLSGIRVIKAFATERKSADRFDAEVMKLQKVSLRQNMVSELSSPTMELISAFGIAAVIWLGGGQVLGGQMTAGAFFSFVGALAMMYEPFKAMNNAMMQMQNALAGAERVFAMLDSEEYSPERGGDIPLQGPFQGLAFEDVGFAYDSGAETVLRDVSFSIHSGEKIALVGPSGAGKTTLINLIPRFYLPGSGRIILNGRDIAEYDLGDLRRYIAVVSQEAFLFNMSVSENIAYGADGAGPDDIRSAARSACADGFVDELPEGYGTALGERGSRLSGGQRQRLTIARAILKNSQLLILDEATSALDSEAESIVQQALTNLMRGKTSIVIAHRLSTVLGADRILVMDRGRIIACGKHADLLHSCELYARLYALQFKSA